MTPPTVAVFVSPHGFGHAARVSAVMAELHRKYGATFELFGATPRWFFDESVAGTYAYHHVITDVGFVQRDALEADLEATVRELDTFLPFDESLVAGLAAEVRDAGCRAVLCDIAPLGIAVADRAGLPSVLLENFTWDWLYAPHVGDVPGLNRHAETLRTWFDRATVHVQAEPPCEPDPGATHVTPVSRAPRASWREARAGLDLRYDDPVVVLTMGGVPQELPFMERLRELDPIHFIVTSAPRTERTGNVRAFHASERLYMPDLIEASDAVVAKLGYSTVAEVWASRRPMAFVTRPDFRETGPLGEWVRREIPGFEIPGREFAGAEWLRRLPELLDTERSLPRPEGGAEAAADAVAGTAGLRPVATGGRRRVQRG